MAFQAQGLEPISNLTAIKAHESRLVGKNAEISVANHSFLHGRVHSASSGFAAFARNFSVSLRHEIGDRLLASSGFFKRKARAILTFAMPYIRLAAFIWGIFFFTLSGNVFALPGDYVPQSVGASNPEVHITTDSFLTLKGAKVEAGVGSTFYLSVRWGPLPMRFVMKTDAKTTVTKRFGGSATVSQIKIGDYLDVEGEFFAGSDFFGVNALRVKDYSLQSESEAFSGRITALSGDTLLTLATAKGTINVRVASTTEIRKGSVILPWNRLKAGDAVLMSDGVYHYDSSTLNAARLSIFQDTLVFRPRNFEGKLVALKGSVLPTSLTVFAEGKTYTVNLVAGTLILANNRKPVLLGRFVEGDTVRFYGAIRESEYTLSDQYVVDAEVVRNLNL